MTKLVPIKLISIKSTLYIALALACFFTSLPTSLALGVVPATTVSSQSISHSAMVRRMKKHSSGKASLTRQNKHFAKHANKKAQKHALKKQVIVMPPQNFVDRLKARTIAPSVIYKSFHGVLNINVIDVDMSKANVQVRPVLAGEAFHCLADVRRQTYKSKALAAVNANYFKKDGTPLGTLILDKEWVAGPLYDRVSLGITRCGYVRIDRVNLHGTLITSNPEVPSIWVNNINQPRRHDCHLIVYTRRWGGQVEMHYEGCLVAVDADGVVVGIEKKNIWIPYNGFVLSDSKTGNISKLKVGDKVQLDWRITPDSWRDVEQAVSGGPMLIKNGRLYLDLSAERFRNNWTGSQIKARTAVGVTTNNHLLLVTVEGPHTLWDVAKLLQKLGAVDAMNLDGGGSTTMVVNGTTVTSNARASERRVASSLVVVENEVLNPQIGANISSDIQTNDDIKNIKTD